MEEEYNPPVCFVPPQIMWRIDEQLEMLKYIIDTLRVIEEKLGTRKTA